MPGFLIIPYISYYFQCPLRNVLLNNIEFLRCLSFICAKAMYAGAPCPSLRRCGEAALRTYPEMCHQLLGFVPSSVQVFIPLAESEIYELADRFSDIASKHNLTLSRRISGFTIHPRRFFTAQQVWKIRPKTGLWSPICYNR